MAVYSLLGVLLILSSLLASGSGLKTDMSFSCKRPTTECDLQRGVCDQATEKCTCLNNARGLQCQIAGGGMGAMFGGGAVTTNDACRMQNPCVRGTCYDDAVQAACICPEGTYGVYCQHDMLQVDCDETKMVINSYPYGFGDIPAWNAPYPATGASFTCNLEPIATFLITAIGYNNRGWEGFAGEFLHHNDPCAGNATVEFDNATMVTYSRQVLVSYSAVGSHPTDQQLVARCDVIKPQTTTAATTTAAAPLPLPSVRVSVTDQMNQPVIGPVKLGSTVKATFSVNVPNSADMTDLQVTSCILTDGQPANTMLIVDKSCVVSPVGVSLYKLSPSGTSQLTLSVHRFDVMSANLKVQCRVRLCTALDTTCSTPPVCGSGRRLKREAITGDDRDYKTVLMPLRLTP